MPFVEERNILGRTKFPVFGILYLILLALKFFSQAGIRATKPFLMTQELNFSEDFSVMLIHSQIAGANIVMLLSNILVDIYSGAYYTYIVQEFVLILVTYPLCFAAIVGYSSLYVRRILYLSGQGFTVLSIGSGSLNSFIGEQFSQINYNKFLAARLYISLVSTFLGILVLPQLVVGFKCFQTESCYAIVWLLDWVISIFIVVLFLSGLKLFRRSRKNTHGFGVLISLAKDGRKQKEKLNNSKLGRWRLQKSGKHRSVMEYSRLYDPITRREAAKVWSTWKFFLPIACFWSLFTQVCTTWMFQASQLNGSLANDSQLVFLPNQIWAVMPFFGLIFLLIVAFWVNNARFPLRLLTASQLALAVAFFTASYLETHIRASEEKGQQLGIYWAIPQHILASFSEITFIMSYRMFNFRTVPRSMQQVSRNMLIISRIFGNFLVVIVILFHYLFKIPSRQEQYFSHSILLSAFIIIFTLFNDNFDRL